MSLPVEVADTLGSLSLAALGVENRDPRSVQAHIEDARRTAPAAFPEGSEDSGHLLSLLAAIERRAVAAGLLDEVAA